MKYSELKEEVRNLFRDDEMELDVGKYINEALRRIWAEPGIDIPGSVSASTITFVPSSNYITLDDMDQASSGVILRIGKLSDDIYIETNPDIFFNNLDTDLVEADVKVVFLDGNNLWYYPRPETTKSLLIIYKRLPNMMKSDNDLPDGLPEAVHYPILVHGAARMLFDAAEQDKSDNKFNTTASEQQYQAGKLMLQAWLSRKRGHVGSSVWRT